MPFLQIFFFPVQNFGVVKVLNISQWAFLILFHLKKKKSWHIYFEYIMGIWTWH